MKSLFIILVSLSFLLNACGRKIEAPESYGPLPTAAQLEWQKLGYYMFIHFGPNTFTNKEWGDGTETPQLFNPEALDCKQWVRIAQEAGMKGIIITAKHHDGFCLWPSNYSTHTVRESPWKEGKGDVLRELSDACKKAGMKFGVYLSPWDRNHPLYGTPEYNQVFVNTLTEVLTNYGDVFEVWFDGANGEGANGKRQIYDWKLFNSTVYKHQPNAVIFSDIGPGCRWIGNEEGYAGETNWSKLNIKGFNPGNYEPLDTLNTGNKYGEVWLPGETNVSIRPGWFYSIDTDDKIKTLEQLVDIYFTSEGRNSNLLLNVPVNRKGLIHDNDSIRLMQFRQTIDKMFDKNLAKNKSAVSNSVKGNSKTYAATNLLDGKYDSFWTTDDNVLTASVEINLGDKITVNCILLQEYIPLGQRVARFDVEVWNTINRKWELVSKGTTIGYKRILRFQPYTTNKIRVNIQESLACPVLNNIEIYNIPSQYIYLHPDKEVLIRESGDLSTEKWNILSPNITNITNIIDGKAVPVFIEKNTPIIVDLGEEVSFSGFFYIPARNVSTSNISRYNFLISNDGITWKTVRSNTMFDNIKNNPIRQNHFFDQTTKSRYIKLEVQEQTNKADEYAIVELGLLK